MPGNPPADPKAPPADPPPAAAEAERISRLEAEQQRQGGILEQILARLSGGAPAPAGGGAKQEPADIGQLVRDGIAELEAKRAADAERDAAKEARESHAARLAALEERVPAEREDSAPGRLRAGVQRVVFGISEPSR